MTSKPNETALSKLFLLTKCLAFIKDWRVMEWPKNQSIKKAKIKILQYVIFYSLREQTLERLSGESLLSFKSNSTTAASPCLPKLCNFRQKTTSKLIEYCRKAGYSRKGHAAHSHTAAQFYNTFTFYFHFISVSYVILIKSGIQ